MKYYFAKSKESSIVSRSSSGGFFSVLASYVMKRNGVVFGAIFDKDFNVTISHTENDFSAMLGSKYVKSSTKNSFAECKDFLENGRTVLYTGTPCQILGLKAYLKKDYENLITMDVICHGSPVAEIWQHYLKSFNKEIESINFRDKRESWEQFHLTIKFKDGTEFSENHHRNKYMKLFLENKILTEPCYKCQNCKNSKADFTVGDAWCANYKDLRLNNHQGTSCIISRNEKSNSIFKSIESEIIYEEFDPSYLTASVGYIHDYIKPNDADRVKRSILSPKIAIVTIPGHENVGNTLQAFALQRKIKEISHSSDPIVINQKDTNHLLNFYKKNVNYSVYGFDNSYDCIIVGSDQIWIPYVWPGVPFEDQFLIRNTYKKIVYGASFGKSDLQFSNYQRVVIHNSLTAVKYIGVREIVGEILCKRFFGIDNAKAVLDPTMLYDSDFYLSSIGDSELEEKDGIFSYVLDKDEKWRNCLKTISDKLGTSVLDFDGSVESFIHNFNRCKYVVTDSYHGSVFSLIFNKPFITLRNKKRGNDRFDDLSIRFNLSERFIESLENIDYQLFDKSPDVLDIMHNYRKGSIEFLTEALMSL